jgi:adenylyltransferase/sulfurtransferase
MVSTLPTLPRPPLLARIAEARIVLVGAGGIGAPAALALSHAGAKHFVVLDDDHVEASNLHRQILFSDEDVGRAKLYAFAEALGVGGGAKVEAVPSRALPENVLEVLRGADVVLDATDNFASRFLLADAAHIVGVPIVHAAAVRWNATVMASPAGGKPCYRCLFEDLPTGDAPDCATAGVLGPICGVAGALAAELALRILGASTLSPYGFVYTFDGRRDLLRTVLLKPRSDCALCGASPSIRAIDESRYLMPDCAT